MSKEIKSFRDLIAWQKAIVLCKQIYELSRTFPDAERFGLTSQIRRAVVSIPSNIAEGYGRGHTKDYLRFLSIARGSLYEVETCLVLTEELFHHQDDRCGECLALVRDLDRIVNALMRSIQRARRSEIL